MPRSTHRSTLACPAGVGMRFVECHAVDVDLLAGERGGTGQPDRYVVMRRMSAVPAQLVQIGFLALAVVRPIAVHLPATILPQRVAEVKPGRKAGPRDALPGIDRRTDARGLRGVDGAPYASIHTFHKRAAGNWSTPRTCFL